jgi:phytanoyl-CoA hydroxylase
MAFATDGLEVLPFLTGLQLEGVRQAIGERIEAAAKALNIAPGSAFANEGIDKRLERIARVDAALAEKLLLSVYTEVHNDERIAFLDGHPPLRAIAERLTGRAVRSFTIRVRANVPSLPGRRQGWHSDVSVLDGGEFSRVKIACWSPLADANAGNGTLEVVPGIRAFPLAHEGEPDGHTILDEALHGMERRVVDCNAGSAVFLDAFVPHRAIPNLSDTVRWSVVTWMMT